MHRGVGRERCEEITDLGKGNGHTARNKMDNKKQIWVLSCSSKLDKNKEIDC